MLLWNPSGAKLHLLSGRPPLRLFNRLGRRCLRRTFSKISGVLLILSAAGRLLLEPLTMAGQLRRSREKKRRTKVEIARGVPMKSTKRIRPYCTHIALRAVQKFPLPWHQVTDASHLCHNPLCIRPDHLVVESRKLNHKRKNCLFKVGCQCCSTVLVVCTHNPPCLHAGEWQDEIRDEQNVDSNSE